MSKIIRRPDRAEGGITPDEKARMAEHAKMWIARAMRTEPIEPEKIVPAIEGLYAAAGLKRPRVVIVPSPLVMAFAFGAAAVVLKSRSKNATDATRAATGATASVATAAATIGALTDAIDAGAAAVVLKSRSKNATRDTRAATGATYDATYGATYGATYDATDATAAAATRSDTRATAAATRSDTRAATLAATNDATRSDTRAATLAATIDATDDATDDATNDATRATASAAIRAIYASASAATNDATDDATAARFDNGAAEACFALAGEQGLNEARKWYEAYQGGNMWAAYDCYLTAARDILGLRLPEHEKYAFWEQAAIHGGFRVMHPDFCMVSDFPEVLRVDDQNRPHCENGPSHRWRDGWSLYHWHGVRIPAEWIEDKASLTPQMALTWQNIEQRRAACEILGWHSILKVLDAKTINVDPDPQIGELVEVTIPDIGRERFLHVLCGTEREFALMVPSDMETAFQANAWTYDYTTETFGAPEVRT